MASMAFRAFVLSVVGQLGDAKIEFESTSLLQPSSRANMNPIKDPKEEVEFMDATDNEIETKAVKGVDVMLEEEAVSIGGNQPTPPDFAAAFQACATDPGSPESCEALQEFARGAYGQDLRPKWDRRNMDDSRSIANSVLIERPMAEVHQALTTSYLWVACYPDTVGVGGIARRPFKSGDIILEKFLFGSKDYNLIRYQVDTNQQNHVLFHGDGIVVGGELPPGLTETEAKVFNSKVGITFEYILQSLDVLPVTCQTACEQGCPFASFADEPDETRCLKCTRQSSAIPQVCQPKDRQAHCNGVVMDHIAGTKWTRKLHFYHAFTGDEETWGPTFLGMLANYLPSQLWGAALYVECVRSFLAPGTEYESELYSTAVWR